mgnify:CR=1 FL=1
MSEYNSFVTGNPCSYTTLGHYNATSQGTMNQARAQVAPKMGPDGQQGVYIVPSYGPGFGYSTLQHGDDKPSCSGFFNITNAYGANANNCNPQFVQRLCSGNVGQ